MSQSKTARSKSASKKRSQTTRPKRASVRERAAAIVARPDLYDADTRRAVRHMMRDGTRPADLAEYVRRAEAGETICDLTAVRYDHEQAARRVLETINAEGLPPFMRDAMIGTITRAGIKARCSTPDAFGDAGDAENVRLLADLFDLTSSGFALSQPPALDSEEEARLESIFRFVTDKTLPTPLYNDLADNLCSLFDLASPFGDFEVFKVVYPRALAAYRAKKDEGARDAS